MEDKQNTENQMSQDGTLPELGTTEEVAVYLGISPRTLENKRYDGTGPRYIKAGRAVRYRRKDVEQWLDDNSRAHSSEAG